MSDSNRRPYLAYAGLALGVFLLIGAVLLITYRNYHAHERDQAAQHQTEASAQEPRTICIRLPGSDRPMCFESGGADEREGYAYRDLQAQQDMAEWAFAMAFAALLTLGVTYVGVLYVARTLDTALAANRGFAQHSERELRAYVHVTDVVVHDLTQGGAPRITYVIQNYGATPARDVEAKGLIMGCPDPHTVKVRHPKDRGPWKWDSKFDLGPSQKSDSRLTSEVTFDATLMAQFRGGHGTILTAGVIRYRDVFGKRHWTLFRAYAVPANINDDGVGVLSAGRKHNRTN
jgi:hypothetical protein